MVDLILDTNVLVEIYSAADLYRAAEEHELRDTLTAGIDSDELRFRRARVRDSLLLAWYLSESNQTSRSLGDEATRTLTRDANPSELGEFRSQFIQVSIYFVKDYLLARWNPTVESGDVRGNAADRILVSRAKELGVPVVSHEVHSDRALRKAARVEGVQVMTPREYWQPHQNEDSAIRALLHRFGAAAPRFLEAQSNSSAARNALATRLAYLKYVLLGLHGSGAVLAR
ncbi:MAG: hypothetical protein JNM69_39995 [Archangium sp.]|nr:hypothetical protein [Archangium sp.]